METLDSPFELELEAAPVAVREARHFALSVLSRVGRDLRDAAVLVVSELVTNAVLHGGGSLRVTVEVGGGAVRILVSDDNPAVPVPKQYSDEAGTGRGLMLVEAVAAAWGVEVDGRLKTVWARLEEGEGRTGRAPEADVSDLVRADRRPADRHPVPPAHLVPGEQLVEVSVLGLPVGLHRRTMEHADDLQREFSLILEEDPARGQAPEGRLLEVVRRLSERFSEFSAGANQQIADAGDHGRDVLNLRYLVPVDLGPVCSELIRLFDEADGYCRSGELLTVRSDEESVAYRRWFFGQFSAQIGGGPATPWPEGRTQPAAAQPARAQQARAQQA